MTLSVEDLSLWYQIAQNKPSHVNEIPNWLESHYKKLFDFSSVFYAYGELLLGNVNIMHFGHVGHTELYIEQLSTTFDLSQRGCLSWWVKNRTSFCLSINSPCDFATQFELDEVKSFALGNVVAHGSINVKNNSGSYFSFAGINDHNIEKAIEIVSFTTPTLNEIYVNCLSNQNEIVEESLLTGRQAEMVRLLLKGLNNKQIAREMKVSDKTVRNYLTTIYSKFNVNSRASLIVNLKAL